MTLVIRKGAVAEARGQPQEQASRTNLGKGLAGSARKFLFALSLGAVGAWLTVGVVLFALFVFIILRS